MSQDIDALELSPVAKEAALALRRIHPSVVFTSGRRDKEAQAHAMASNVIHNRNWIAQTYKQSAASMGCQSWVNQNPQVTDTASIAAGLLSVFNGLSDADLSKISKHLSGDAFDVQPVEQNAEAIKATIRSLPGLQTFLDHEGGLCRWHAQFNSNAAVS